VPAGARSCRMSPTGVLILESSGSIVTSRGGASIPALEPVANRPIVHHVLDALIGAGVEDLIAVAPAMRLWELRECVEAQGAPIVHRIHWLQQADSFDTAGGLRSCAPLVGSGPCIVHFADGLIGEPLARCVSELGNGSPDVVLLVHRGAAGAERLGVASQRALHLAELDPERSALGIAGACVLGPGALARIAADWPSGAGSDLAAVADQVVAAGGEVQIRLVDAWRRYTGKPLDLLELNRMALDLLEPTARHTPSNGNRIEGRVQIDKSALIRSSVVVGPAIIGADAQILDAYIGPYTAVGSGVRVEGAEVERSILSPGSSIMHVGARLVASVVGRDARVFRDFSLPRALRLRIGEGDEVALC
jgi:glucose-1-phosphate thymidylyltransferase